MEEVLNVYSEGVYLSKVSLGFVRPKTFGRTYVWMGIPLLRIQSANTRCFPTVLRAAGCDWFQRRILRSCLLLDSTINPSEEPSQPVRTEQKELENTPEAVEA